MVLTKVLQTYPQPIAYAYGCILRSSSKSEPEQLDRILRCAEVTARYSTSGCHKVHFFILSLLAD